LGTDNIVSAACPGSEPGTIGIAGTTFIVVAIITYFADGSVDDAVSTIGGDPWDKLAIRSAHKAYSLAVVAGFDVCISVVAGFAYFDFFVSTAKGSLRLDAPKLDITAIICAEFSLFTKAIVWEMEDFIGQFEACVQGARKAVIKDRRIARNAPQSGVAEFFSIAKEAIVTGQRRP